MPQNDDLDQACDRILANKGTAGDITTYVNDLADRLMHVPVMYGVDGGDISILQSIGQMMDRLNVNKKA
ncbi:MAG: hypothetical protein EOO77_29315 [Oxalobacteraceae bacterium]|nr:MAG: hypothetical protein EOO77_29315 [Oxalobacteraceae bacterium]